MSQSGSVPLMSLIVAAAENGCIGVANDLPWRLSDDLRHFKATTSGKAIIMGRKTWDSIGRPLPKRLNIVLSRTVAELDGAEIFSDFELACQRAEQWSVEQGQSEYFIIGGAQLYGIALPLCDRLYYTRVRASLDGDEFLPSVDWSLWQLQDKNEYLSDERNDFDFSIERWNRR